MRKNLLLFIAALLIFAITSRAQTDTCITHLKDAGNRYDQGDYDGAIALLKSSIENCHLDKSDRVQAYKLLIQCYLSVDNLEAADNAAERIIKINPNFTPDKFRDEPKLISIFRKFKPQPVFAIGISGGVNKPSVKTIQQYSVVYSNGEAPESYKTKTGFQLGLFAEKRMYKNLWAELGFNYRSSAYERTLFDIDSTDVHYAEKLTYFDAPLSAKYYFSINRFQPYIQAGIWFSFLSNALGTTTRDDQKDITDRTPLRNASGIGWFGAAGIGYSVKSLMFFANVRYVYFPNNVNKAGTRYQDEVNLFKYYYLDNDFRLNSLQFNIGASLTLAYKNMKVK